MLTYTGTFKPKPKNSTESMPQYLSHYPLDNNRKSIPNGHQPPKVHSAK